jgi:HAD superfamily hydrolase (TIGR01509 family)
MSAIQALLWDVDGTIAETERDGHRVAFNLAFEACGLPWRWDVERYGELLRVTGGRERLLHDMATRGDAPVLVQERKALAERIHQRKNALYAELVAAGDTPLRPGVVELMQACRDQGVRMGIATTTSRSNVEALLGKHLGAAWASWFGVIVCGEDVRHKKPDPEVYDLALSRLGIDALQALAIEDSPGGVAAARAAHVPVVVTRSAYFQDDTVEGAIAIGPGLDRRQGWTPPVDPSAGTHRGLIGLDDLVRWHQRMEHVSRHR